MAKISDQTLNIFDQIYQSHFGVRGIFSDTEVLEKLLIQIEESGDVFAIPGLLLFLLKMNKTRAKLIAETVDRLLRQIPINKLPQFDEQLRMVYRYAGFSDLRYLDWSKISPQQVLSLLDFGEFASSLLGVLSFHNNGYIREASSMALATIRDGSEIPFLLLRVNDWVQVIRKVAYQALLDRCSLEYAVHFTKNLPLVMRLESCDRSDHTHIINSIVSQLEKEDSWNILLVGIQSEEMLERRAAFNIAIRSSNSKLIKQGIELGIQSQDTLIRVRSTQKVKLITNPDQLAGALSVLRIDPFMPVRLAALRHYVELSAENAFDELYNALLDKHISVREFARYHLNKMEPIDFGAYYRVVLSECEEAQIYAAIGGIGETGESGDDILVLPFVNHRLVRIRMAALRALAKLNLPQHTKTFIASLEDKSPKVSREAVRALTQSRDFISHQEAIWRLIEGDSASHVKLNAFSLLCKLSKWDSIYYLLKSARLDDELIQKRANIALKVWWASYNRSFTKPNEFQKKRIREELDNNPSLGRTRGALEDIFQTLN